MVKDLGKIVFNTFLGSSLSISAGEFSTGETLSEAVSLEEIPLEAEDSKNCSFCDALRGLGTPIYKNPNNPFIQEFRLRGRTHYQFASVDGDNDGEDFSANGGELRRFWGGVQFKAFNRLDVIATGRFSEQGFRNHDIQYNEVDALSVDYRLDDFGPLKGAKLGYGRYRMDFGREWHTSVNKIKTPERAPVFDRFIVPRATSVRFQGQAWGVDFKLDYLTTDDSDGLARWNGAEAVHIATEWNALRGRWFADAFVVNADQEDDELLDYEKAFSLAYEWKMLDWTVFVNGVWGDVEGGDIWGVVSMAHRPIYKNKVEAVLRYQYAAANDNLLRVGGRASRNVAAIESQSVGLGEVVHNAYAGINFYGLGIGAKTNSTLLLGVEWDRVSRDDEDLEAVTLWANYRIFF